MHDVDGNLIDNGIFTHFILRGLSGAADHNRDGVLTFRELSFFVAQEMNNLSFARPDSCQIPFWQKEMAREDPIAGLEAARGNATVQAILDELLVPYCRMAIDAIDARDDSVLEFLFGFDRFEIREKTTLELRRAWQGQRIPIVRKAMVLRGSHGSAVARGAMPFHEAHFRREGSYASIPLYRAT